MKQSMTKITIKCVIAILLLSVFSSVFLSAAQEKESVSQDADHKTTPKHVDVYLYKKNENYEVKRLETIIGDFNYYSDYKRWKNNYANGRIVSFRNEILGYFFLANSLAIFECVDSRDEKGNMVGGCKELSEGDITIHLPYFPNGKYADIYDPSGKKVLTIDLTSKATCNENDKCNTPVEDSENCPRDCVKGETKLDPVLMEKAGATQSDTENSSATSNKWILIAAGIFFALSGLGFWLWRRYSKVKDRIY
jgi:hypothetical protein